MSAKSLISTNPNALIPLFFILLLIPLSPSSNFVNSARTLSSLHKSKVRTDESLTFLWPLPAQYTFGNQTLTVDPNLSLVLGGRKAGNSNFITEAFMRYKSIIFKHPSKESASGFKYDITKLSIIVHSENEELQLGVDESYSLLVAKNDGHSIIGEVTIEANTLYGALRGLETMSQLCVYDYESKSVKVFKAPWFIQDQPRFQYRGLLLDTSRHYQPVEIIKQVIDSMSYAKLNVLHWHIIDEESFPLEVPEYPKLWSGSYTKWERYTVEDALEIVSYAKLRGINVMPEVDVPGHAESWGKGYPDLWPSPSCTEPLDVSKNFTFDVIAGILTGMQEIFPFKLFHLGGDEVNTDCWTSTPHVAQWLEEHNMSTRDAYRYFVIKAQEIALSHDRIPVNWEETFNTFPSKLSPETIVHNWLGPGVCPKAVAQGFKCIYSNQGVWYLDHLDIPWENVYYAEPLEGINNASLQNLVIGGEVCMWGETADASDVLQTIWPRAAAAAERLWSNREATSSGISKLQPTFRLEYFRCLLTRRGIPAAPVKNYYARTAPPGYGSCYEQ
ncbi:OLC1v1027726C1 [Oldenlandia corymbosa var. corymbosa]|uniref:Beta-hexosaminidase n=1 Tax=Oldenlandia corymbosa var. corymbosa TaxID=529605 RepID=A0AAV1CDB1_OLDCO|nr:OLC1v1027726C1 [Oldenlandia corymbosa var. corymbosa]